MKYLNIIANARTHSARFMMGGTVYKALNDGGLSIKTKQRDCSGHFHIGAREKYHWQALIIETKRKSSAKFRTDTKREVTTTNHAAQMFGEMLAQVCHPELFKTNLDGYQESFVIYCRHDKAALFYAKLPHKYLQWVAEEKNKSQNKYRTIIPLKRTRWYLMRFGDERAAFFELLAKLLWYLGSGKSHVGFCRNEHDSNPIYAWVLPHKSCH